jgi:large subunit ribosomal protein L21
MYAVILTGGKQYRVKDGDVLSVEKIDVDQGQKVNFGQVLLVEDGQNILLGAPFLENAIVRAEILETYKDEKVLVFKKKRRKQFRRTRGHRQQLTRIRVEGIYPDKSAAPAVEAPKPRPAPAVSAQAPAPKTGATAPVQAAAESKKKRGVKIKKPGKEAKAKAAPKGKTVGKKTAGGKAAPNPKKATKE